MRTWRSTLVLAAMLTLAACGYREQRVVDQYFGALEAGDNQTLSSFATVKLDQKVERWKIVGESEEVKVEAPLPGLVKQAAEAEAKYATEKKDMQKIALQDYNTYSQAQDILKKGGKPPANLKDMVAKLEAWSQRERELKGQIADARAAAEAERRIVVLSVGPDVADLDTQEAEKVTKSLDLLLTIGGQEQPWLMRLRRYGLKEGSGPRLISRWVVEGLDKK